jgi:hypothetical protein
MIADCMPACSHVATTGVKAGRDATGVVIPSPESFRGGGPHKPLSNAAFLSATSPDACAVLRFAQDDKKKRSALRLPQDRLMKLVPIVKIVQVHRVFW